MRIYTYDVSVYVYTQGAQHGLIKEYALHHTKDPHVVSWALWGWGRVPRVLGPVINLAKDPHVSSASENRTAMGLGEQSPRRTHDACI